MGLASFNSMRLRRVEEMKAENLAKEEKKEEKVKEVTEENKETKEETVTRGSKRKK